MRSFILAAGLLFGTSAIAQDSVSPADRLFHEEMLVLDTHLDTPQQFERPGWDFGDWHNYFWDRSQVDIPRMEAGGLDGGFFVIFTEQKELSPQGYQLARASALGRARQIQRIVGENKDKLAFATRAADAERLHREGKRIVYQSIENSYPLGLDVSLLETFYKLGVRMASPVHAKNNQFADSTTDKPRWNGLSPLGRQWMAEANRLGILVDGSHSSDATFDQLVALSKTPIILSHSGPRAIFDHPRNLDDDRMRKLAKSGGVMQINSVFLAPQDRTPPRMALIQRQQKWLELSPAERRTLVEDISTQNSTKSYTEANFEIFMRSMLHAIRIMGAEHVGVGADWDGGGGVEGMWDVAALPKITARLRKEGIKDADIAKIMGGNTIRLLRQAEDHASKR